MQRFSHMYILGSVHNTQTVNKITFYCLIDENSNIINLCGWGEKYKPKVLHGHVTAFPSMFAHLTLKSAKLNNLIFHPLKDVSRYRDTHFKRVKITHIGLI